MTDDFKRDALLIHFTDKLYWLEVWIEDNPPPTPTPSNQRWNWESGCYMWPAGIFLNYFFKAFWWRFDKGCTSCVALCYRQSSVMDHWALCCSGAHIVHFCRAPASCLSFHQLCYSLPAARLRKMRRGHASWGKKSTRKQVFEMTVAQSLWQHPWLAHLNWM